MTKLEVLNTKIRAIGKQSRVDYKASGASWQREVLVRTLSMSLLIIKKLFIVNLLSIP